MCVRLTTSIFNIVHSLLGVFNSLLNWGLLRLAIRFWVSCFAATWCVDAHNLVSDALTTMTCVIAIKVSELHHIAYLQKCI